jgi:hypothetical protein
VYACGPNAMLRAVAESCRDQAIPCQVAVEEKMACGFGVCWSCAVPVIASDGRGWWNVRACVEGPVFNGARIWWERWLGGPVEREGGDPATVPTSEQKSQANGFQDLREPETTEARRR